MAEATVAIVGRPNVGKSTVFNRIIGQRLAIVEDRPGVTRDRLYGKATWKGRTFSVIDTGGIQFGEDDELLKSVRAQAELAMDEADVVVFMVDAKAGLTHADREVAELLYRKSDRPVVLAVNKVDHPKHRDLVYEFYALGFGEPIAVSGEHGHGIGELLDAVVAKFPDEEPVEPYGDDVVRIAVIGRPNVGKSSLVNALLGRQRVIVSDVAGTTRDAVDTPFERDGKRYVLIDTAGIRKRGKIYETTEKYSVLRALRAIERCDVALVVLDAKDGVTEQDKHIAGYAEEAGRASVIVVNKWDAIEKDDKTMQRFTERIRDAFKFMPYAPVVFVSAATGQRINLLLPAVDRVAEEHARRIPTSVLNDVISDAVATTPPPSDRGRRLKIKYAAQVAVKPPTIVLFVNDPELLHFSYERFLENRLRAAFRFEGTPIRLIARAKDDDDRE